MPQDDKEGGKATTCAPQIQNSVYVCDIVSQQLLCDTTPRRASVATNRLWRVAART